MARTYLRTFIGIFMLFHCPSFGHMGPNLVIDEKIIPFDPKYTRLMSEAEKSLIYDEVNSQIDRALALGVTSIGKVGLVNLKKEIKDVHLYIVRPEVSALGSGQFSARLGSVYLVENKSIYFNGQVMNRNLKQTISMQPHEFAGALGINDQNYLMSSVLRSKNIKELANKIEKSNLDLSLKRSQSPQKTLRFEGSDQSSGGTTVIGGGGDEILFSAKVFMLDHFDIWKNQILPKFLETDQFKTAQAKTTFDLKSKINIQTLDDYLIYFLQVPFEPMTYKLGLIQGPLQNPDDVKQICGIFENESSSPYIRLSRDHWERSIGSLGIEQSQLFITAVTHTQLFFAYLKMRFEK